MIGQIRELLKAHQNVGIFEINMRDARGVDRLIEVRSQLAKKNDRDTEAMRVNQFPVVAPYSAGAEVISPDPRGDLFVAVRTIGRGHHAERRVEGLRIANTSRVVDERHWLAIYLEAEQIAAIYE
ncbi:hypothetical protein Dac01nite_19400 [Demequina activiva]|uniref:Uncharacterized protein n=1 Tax=Demequina activiva TaxID=1582364 RepID=A0A919Q6N3_9MICO|nr:hypothetical protein Dac01nite_19400 [Demequina activiva]